MPRKDLARQVARLGERAAESAAERAALDLLSQPPSPACKVTAALSEMVRSDNVARALADVCLRKALAGDERFLRLLLERVEPYSAPGGEDVRESLLRKLDNLRQHHGYEGWGQ